MLLVIGYGNELRRDDGVGPRVARAVEEWKVPELQTVAAHQLLPEMADLLAQKTDALFVDASLDLAEEVRIRPVLPAEGGDPSAHAGSPEGLLALCLALHGRAPASWLLTVAAHDTEHGEGLSAAAEAGMKRVLHHIRRWVGKGEA